MTTNELSRRTVLSAPALLSLSGSATASIDTIMPAQSGCAKALVAYFSRSGNTRVIAGTIQRLLDADVFEIRAAQAYPDDYEATVERARRERDGGFEPALAATVPDIAAYDTVFLGFPIWGETTPPVIRTFLRAHNLAGNTIRPFITHGGYGLGSSRAVLADHAPNARIEPPFSMEADQERRTLNQVRTWLSAAEDQ